MTIPDATTNVMIALYHLGFQEVRIIANIQSVDTKAFTDDGVWVHNQSSTIENALLGLLEGARAYIGFSDETKEHIKQAQQL